MLLLLREISTCRGCRCCRQCCCCCYWRGECQRVDGCEFVLFELQLEQAVAQQHLLLLQQLRALTLHLTLTLQLLLLQQLLLLLLRRRQHAARTRKRDRGQRRRCRCASSRRRTTRRTTRRRARKSSIGIIGQERNAHPARPRPRARGRDAGRWLRSRQNGS